MKEKEKNPMPTDLLNKITDVLKNQGFTSTQANFNRVSHGFESNGFFGGREFRFFCNSLDANYEEICDILCILLSHIVLSESSLNKMQEYYKSTLVQLDFCDIKINTDNIRTLFVKARKDGFNYRIRLLYPKHKWELAQNNTQDNTISLNIDEMDGVTFEKFCADLLLKNGFDKVDCTKSSGDQGVDLIAQKEGIRYAIQCKCYSEDVGNKAVQEVYSGKAYYKCHVGAVLTNRFFTRSAKELANSNGILLWDRSYLNKLIHKTKA